MSTDNPKRLPLRCDWDKAFAQLSLPRFIQSRFPRLSIEDCEDVSQAVYMGVAKMIDRGEPFLTGEIEGYAMGVAKNRARDLLRRRRESHLFGRAAEHDDVEMRDPIDRLGLTPSKEASENERHDRKTKTLAAIFEEFCRYCEQDRRRRRWKEVVERTLRGESTNEIVDRMEFSSESAALEVFHRAFDPLVTIIQEQDRNGSILKTLAFVLGIEKEQDGNRRPRKLGEYVQSYEVVKRYLFEESGAFCPTPEHLVEFRSQPSASHFADIRYHLEAGCPLCEPDNRPTDADTSSRL